MEIDLVRDFLLNLHEYWHKLPDPLKNQFLSLILDKVEISYMRPDSTIEAAVHWRTGTVQTITIHFRSCWAEPDWTNDEIELLRRLWPSEPSRSLVKAFSGRNWTSIKVKAHRMGLRRRCREDRKMRRRRWQPWEESLIREAASGAITVDDVVSQTGRSYRTIYWKAWRMGLGEGSDRKIKVTWEEKGTLPVTHSYFDISNAGMIALKTI